MNGGLLFFNANNTKSCNIWNYYTGNRAINQNEGKVIQYNHLFQQSNL